MKIEPGMLCEVLPAPYTIGEAAQRAVGNLVEVLYPSVRALPGFDHVPCWRVTLDDGGEFDAQERFLRPLSPPPMPAKEEERELVV